MDSAAIQRTTVETPAHAGVAPVSAVGVALRSVADTLRADAHRLERLILDGSLTGRPANRVSVRVTSLRNTALTLEAIARDLDAG